MREVVVIQSNAYVYEFPAGFVEPGEEMAQAGIREIYEETGACFRASRTSGRNTQDHFFTTVGMTERKLWNNPWLL